MLKGLFYVHDYRDVIGRAKRDARAEFAQGCTYNNNAGAVIEMAKSGDDQDCSSC